MTVLAPAEVTRMKGLDATHRAAECKDQLARIRVAAFDGTLDRATIDDALEHLVNLTAGPSAPAPAPVAPVPQQPPGPPKVV
jgi:hypothetical protein